MSPCLRVSAPLALETTAAIERILISTRIFWTLSNVYNSRTVMFCKRRAMTIAENQARSSLDRLAADLRPKLHRFCARMTGSVIDGEDVVQEALLKVVEAVQRGDAVEHPEAWL